MATVNSENLNGWMNLVQSEQKYYSTIGIQVSLAREVSSSGIGSDRHMRNDIVGLKFDIGADPLAPQQHKVAGGASGGDGHVDMAVPIAVVSSDASDDIVSKLERLDQLFRKGALSHEEYETAKAKILG